MLASLATMSLDKKVVASPNQQLALTNCVFLNRRDHDMLSSDGAEFYVEVPPSRPTSARPRRASPAALVHGR